MKYAFATFFRLAYRTFFDNQDTAARLTAKRFLVMSFFLLAFFLLQMSHFLGLALDNLFFKQYQNIKIKKPLFIIGIPRSGTTFLHRALAADNQRVTTFTLWELLLAPSIIEKKFWVGLSKLDHRFGAPLARLMSFSKRLSIHGLDEIHEISLTAPEEDFLLLAPIFACFLLIVPFPFEEIWRLAYFDDQLPNKDKMRIMSFYKSCLQRHLYFWGQDKQLVSKNASFIPFINSIRKTFPDCRIICTVRDPLQVVPSLLSSMQYAMHIFDNDTRDCYFRDPFVGMLKDAYKHLITLLPTLIANGSLFVFTDEMHQNIENVVVNIYRHFHYDLSEPFLKYLHAENELSHDYQSCHHYSLDEFGLKAETILIDFKFVYDFFAAYLPVLKN